MLRFRSFSLRRMEKVKGEWNVIASAWGQATLVVDGLGRCRLLAANRKMAPPSERTYFVTSRSGHSLDESLPDNGGFDCDAGQIQMAADFNESRTAQEADHDAPCSATAGPLAGIMTGVPPYRVRYQSRILKETMLAANGSHK